MAELPARRNAAPALLYMWDGENRLSCAAPPASHSPPGPQCVKCAYDYLSRRVWKKVYTKAGGSWVLTEHRKFVWAGWLLLMELNGTDNAVLRKYTWGLDVAGLNGNQSRDREGAGFLQAAGGIGGLLAVCDTHGTPGTTGDDLNYAYFYDGNGNVGQLADWSVADPAAALVARYEYDPYGGDLLDPNNPSQSGSYAATNVFRFSTRPQDGETGLYQWPRRPYDPRLGRWITRDPIEEDGGSNLYGYVGNHPTVSIDALGNLALDDTSDGRHKTACCVWRNPERMRQSQTSCTSCARNAVECCHCGDTGGPNLYWLHNAHWGPCCSCRVEVRRGSDGPTGWLNEWPNHVSIFVKCSNGTRWHYGHPEGYGDGTNDGAWVSKQYPTVVESLCVACETATKMEAKARSLVGTPYDNVHDCYWGVRTVKWADPSPVASDDCPKGD